MKPVADVFPRERREGWKEGKRRDMGGKERGGFREEEEVKMEGKRRDLGGKERGGFREEEEVKMEGKRRGLGEKEGKTADRERRRRRGIGREGRRE